MSRARCHRYAADATAADVVVTRLSDARVEFRLPTFPALTLLPVGGADAGVSTTSFANVVLRATAPAAHFLAPVSRYRP